MSSFPDFAAHSYQIIKELGHNLEGGRFTYLAKRLTDNVDVAIKQFQFATGAGWDGYKAIEREIQSLQGLNHRGIPKYLDKFETANGYCLVTEYFPADTLAVGRSFTPDEIKQIAVQLLEILVYLQERMPPVIHRDVKPENILVDHNLNVYLIDFGFARVGSGSVAMSSANAGTFGFMAPEQIRNLKLTNASDLYGLGLTLICLIGAIRSTDIGNYIDFSNQLDRSKIDPKLKGCSLTFVKWLDQMVAPDPSKRFADAKVALDALKPLYVVRVPEVKFFKDGVEFDPSKTVLEFKATKLGEKLTQTITLVNSVPETILEGHWEVAPHPNDPPHSPDNHAWISFRQKKFEGNRVDCEILLDTSKLTAESTGQRLLTLYINTSESQKIFPLRVITSSLPIESNIFSNSFIVSLAVVICIFFVLTVFLLSMGALSNSIYQVFIGSMAGSFIIFAIMQSQDHKEDHSVGAFLSILVIILGVFFISGIVGSFALLANAIFVIGVKCLNFNHQNKRSEKITLFTIFLGFCLGTAFLLIADKNWLIYLFVKANLGALVEKILPVVSADQAVTTLKSVLNIYSLPIYTSTLTTSSSLSYILFYPSFEHQRKIADYRRKEEHLIKP